MSARQMKRLLQQQDALEGCSDEETLLPSTVKAKASKKKSSKPPAAAGKPLPAQESPAVSSPPSAAQPDKPAASNPPSSAKAATQAPTNSSEGPQSIKPISKPPKSTSAEKHHDAARTLPPAPEGGCTVPTATKASAKKVEPAEAAVPDTWTAAGETADSSTQPDKEQAKRQRKQAAKDARRSKAAAEERLLDALAGGGAAAATTAAITDTKAKPMTEALPGDGGPAMNLRAIGGDYAIDPCDQQARSVGFDAAVAASAALAAAWVETCDPDRLDPRKEKIRKLGLSAVEGTAAGNTANNTNRQNPYVPPNAKPPTFRQSPFATPDRYAWPPFASLLSLAVGTASPGAAASAAPTRKPRGTTATTVYGIDSVGPDNAKADAEFDRQVRAMADVRTMMLTCLRSAPYHLPTLLQLHTAFAVLGNIVEGQGMLDRALYAVGVLLARFPLAQTSASRLLPYSDPRNQQVFLCLCRGVHSALKMGCAETAMGLCKLLLSLDPDCDPKAALLCVDYCAVRAKEWPALVAMWPAMAARLPGFAFHGALAKFLLEQQHEEEAANPAVKKKQQQPPASAPPSAPDAAGAGAAAALSTSATEMLIEATLLHPRAATLLCEKAELKLALPSSSMTLVALADSAPTSSACDRVSKLFADRSFDLWKSKDVQRWAANGFAKALEQAAGAAKGTGGGGTCSFRSLAALHRVRDSIPHSVLLRRYRDATAEDVLGATVNRIPAELLANFQRDDEAAEMMMWQQQQQQQQQHEQVMVTQYDHDNFRRMQAAFGPVPGSYHEQLATYIDRLTVYEQRLGQDHSAVALFLRTLLPGAASIREMAIQRALSEAGVEDPIAVERRQLRQQDDAFYVEPTGIDDDDDDEGDSSDGG